MLDAARLIPESRVPHPVAASFIAEHHAGCHLPVRRQPEWIGLYEAAGRLESQFQLGYSASLEMTQHAVLSRETPVRGIAAGNILHHIITGELKSDMRVVISFPLSEIHENGYRAVFWRDIQIIWPKFLSYVNNNLLPPRARAMGSSGRGRKKATETLKDKIHAEFETMTLSCKWGELTRIAKKLSKQFSPYKTDTIRKMIQLSYKQKCAERSKSK